MRNIKLAIAVAAASAAFGVALPAAASAAPATSHTAASSAVRTGGDWGGWRHHRRFGFGRFGFPVVSPFFFGGGFNPFLFGGGFGGFPFGFGGDCWGGFADHQA